jgi:nucleoside-diphosphate kinase
MQRTLVLLKPDALQRGIVGEIISRFEKAGMKIVGMKMIKPSKEFAEKHYYDIEERHGKEILDRLTDYLGMGPVIAFVLEGTKIIERVRKLVGKTEPHSAEPGTIRGDYSHLTYEKADDPNTEVKTLYNLIHASANEHDAKHEISLWFSDSELWEYKTVHEMFT